MLRSLLVLAAATQLVYAGGMWVVLGNPEASAEARAMKAVATARVTGCHDGSKAQVSATAFGIVDGKRQTIPLKLTALKEPGMYALTRQWPDKGRWVVEFVGRYSGAATTTLVADGPAGLDRLKAKQNMRPPSQADVDAMLAAGPEIVAQK